MKSSNQDKVQGTFHEAKGKVRETVGKITDNPKLEAKGKAETIAGKEQEKVGQVKKTVWEIVRSAHYERTAQTKGRKLP